MPLDIVTYSADLKAAFAANLPGITPAQDAALTTTCDAIAAATAALIQTATITYTVGLVDGVGPVTGDFGNVIT